MRLVMGWIMRVAMVMCCASIVALIFVVSYEVVSRSVFNTPTTWAVELSSYMFLWLGLMAACVALAENRHLKVKLIVKLLPERIQNMLEILGLFLMFLVSIVMVWQGSIYWWEAYVTGWVHSWGLLFVPLSYTRVAVPVTGIMLGALIALKIYDKIQDLRLFWRQDRV